MEAVGGRRSAGGSWEKKGQTGGERGGMGFCSKLCVAAGNPSINRSRDRGLFDNERQQNPLQVPSSRHTSTHCSQPKNPSSSTQVCSLRVAGVVGRNREQGSGCCCCCAGETGQGRFQGSRRGRYSAATRPLQGLCRACQGVWRGIWGARRGRRRGEGCG